MLRLRREGQAGLDAITKHREDFISLEDFRRLKASGVNSLRLPFGYWIVLGPLGNDPYFGPGLEYVDRAVAWAEEVGLQILLDLHGCPGGESAEAPCGRRRRPRGPKGQDRWRWRQWHFEETLRALRVVARRYRNSKAVTGIAVCNEPSPEVPLPVLSRFYARAVAAVRRSGMAASRVSVVLPVFQRPLAPFAAAWKLRAARSAKAQVKLCSKSSRSRLKKGKVRKATRVRKALIGRTVRTARKEALSLRPGELEDNICFEVHWYHCFENYWHGRTFAQHLRAVQEHAQELQRFPIVVGEWSLALGCGVQPGRLSLKQMRTLFAQAQLAAYSQATHGWFFWNWSDNHGVEWDWLRARSQGLVETQEIMDCTASAESHAGLLASSNGTGVLTLSPKKKVACPTSPLRVPILSALSLLGTPRPSTGGGAPLLELTPLALPTTGRKEKRLEVDDPLEAVFDVPSSDPRVRMGDTVYLRAFHGRYLDVEGSTVRARYGDRGLWQQFMICPFLGCHDGGGSQGTDGSESDVSSQANFPNAPLRDGDVVSLLSHHTGRFLGVEGRRGVAARWQAPKDPCCAFYLRTQSGVQADKDASRRIRTPRKAKGPVCDDDFEKEEAIADVKLIDREVRHRTAVFLQSCSTSRVLAPNENEAAARDLVVARWKNFGNWQRMVIEKPRSTAVTPMRPRRRLSFDADAKAPPAGPASPPSSPRRQASPVTTPRQRPSLTGQGSPQSTLMSPVVVKALARLASETFSSGPSQEPRSPVAKTPTVRGLEASPVSFKRRRSIVDVSA